MLMVLTSIVGMCLAPATSFPIIPLIIGNLGIALVASSAAVLNHIADQSIDKIMGRTQHRPLVKGAVTVKASALFSGILCILGIGILLYYINVLTAVLTGLSLMGYAVFYTRYLKHKTPQNIVIGGIAGASPPLLGWVAVTGSISPLALLLVLIIYIWTPPHFWALAIYRVDDYIKANVPMLPHTHGIAYTKLNIVLYTVLLICVSSLPYFIQMAGIIYIIGISGLNLIFLFYAIALYYHHDNQYAFATFKYSIYYLGGLFLLLLIDHILIKGGT
jgi:protoheme IX farnesyltransferase